MTLPICKNCQHCFTAYTDNSDALVWPNKEGQYRTKVMACQLSATKLIIDPVSGARREQGYVSCVDLRGHESEKESVMKRVISRNSKQESIEHKEQLGVCDHVGKSFVPKETTGLKFANWWRGRKKAPAGYVNVELLMKREDFLDPNYDPMKAVRSKYNWKTEDSSDEN